jgi:NADPH:quinone reductase-like Zn-dependent oxidoreductase
VPEGGSVLVHGGGSGVGTAAITLCREAGVRIIVTAGSPEKCARCLAHGADVAINYRDGDFAPAVRAATDDKGVDVVLDAIGARYLEGNLAALAMNGRLVVIGLMGGTRAELDLAGLMVKRQQIIGSTLRVRPAAEKKAIVDAFLARFGSALDAGRIKPVIDRVLPLDQAGEAHRIMKASEHFGKIVLTV